VVTDDELAARLRSGSGDALGELFDRHADRSYTYCFRWTASEVVDAVPYDAGTTYLFATEEKWVVCDTWAMVDGGPPTVTSVRTFGQPLSKQLLLVSQNFSMNEADGAQFFAAGARIPGVDFIQFSFPDGTEGDGGHLVDATMTDHMWVMQYLPPEPPRRAWTTPVKVVATLDDGVKAQYFLADVDLCAQVNHGC
jgi:hypothetical protein